MHHRFNMVLRLVMLIILLTGMFGQPQTHVLAAATNINTITIPSTPAGGAALGYSAGEAVTVRVTFTAAETVTGTPSITLNIGGNLRKAYYVSGSGTASLDFAYTVVAGDMDANGISIPANTLALNGGSINNGTDAAQITHAQVADQAADIIAASVAALDITAPVLRSAVGAGSTITLFYDELGSGLRATPLPPLSDFTFSRNGGVGPQLTITSVSINHTANTLTLGLNGLINTTDTNMWVSYTANGTNDVQDVAGNKIANFSNVFVANTMPSFDVKGNTLSFDNPSSITGDGRTAGNRVLFSNIITVDGQSIDAIVTTTALNSATLAGFDTLSGTATPILTTTPAAVDALWFKLNTSIGGTGGDATITFDFIKSGSYNAANLTATKGDDVILQNVVINSYDLDGAGGDIDNYQYQEFGGFATYTVANNSALTQTQVGALTHFQTTTGGNVTDSPGTDAGDQIRVMALYEAIHQFQIKTGAIATGGTAYYYLDFSKGANWFNPTLTYEIPTVNPKVTNDSTPDLNGTFVGTAFTSGVPSATVQAYTLRVTVNGKTYTAGDAAGERTTLGNGDIQLLDATTGLRGVFNPTTGVGTWTLTIPPADALPLATYNVGVDVGYGTSLATINKHTLDDTTNELVINGTPPDTTAPTFISITRGNPVGEFITSSALAVQNHVDFIVTFSETVTNVDLTDFQITGAGSSGSTISSVTQTGPTVYTVRVAGIPTTNTGILDLNLLATTDVVDLAGNLLTKTIDPVEGVNPTSGIDETYLITHSDLELDKQINDATPYIGTDVTFSLVVSNTGTTAATNVVVTDVVPSGYTYVASSIAGGDSDSDTSPAGTGLTWTINSLAAGASTTLTFRATVLASGIYNNYAEITSQTEGDDDSTPGNGSTTEDDDDTVTVTPVAPPVATISVAPASVVENGVANLVYTVTLDKALLVGTTINLSTTGTATGSDYTGAVTSVLIPAGSTTATVTVDPTPDTIVEPDETVILTIISGTGYAIGTPSSATGTITNDDIPVATIAVSPASVAEDGATNLVYTVTLDKAPAANTTINLSTSGTASGIDYAGSVAFVTIPAGSTTATVTIDPTPDTSVELDETVILTITSGTGYTIGSPSSATGTIIDNDLPVATITVTPASVAEDGAANLVYTVTLDKAPAVSTTINLSTTGTASGTDYTGSVASVTFPAGSTIATVTVDPTSDIIVEADETVILTITSGTGYTVGTPSSATGTITNDDATVVDPVATITVSPASVVENGATSLVYTVTLDKAALVDTTINLGTTGTATGADYTGTVTSVIIPAGNTTATVTIDPTPDTTIEPDETVIITINSGTGYSVGTPSSATGTITNDDVPVATITVSPASVAEDGATNLVYTVTLNQAPLVNTTVNLSTSGTASGTDYSGSVASVTIPAGSTTGTVTIAPTADTTVEPDETVIIAIDPGTGYTVGSPSSATGTITDNDLPVATITVAPVSVAEDGAINLVYTVTLDQAPSVDTTINLSTSGTADSFDYSGAVISVLIPANSMTATVTIDPTADASLEPNETVVITIDPGTGYVVGSPSSATGTITNDDTAPAPMIGIAKRVVSTTEVSPGTWDVTYAFYIENDGNVTLSWLQVVDDLSVTFPLPTTFTVRSISSTQFTENTSYDGSSDTNLLTGDDTLAAGGSGTITLVVRIVPASGGPFENVATVSGMDPTETTVTDDSQDGTDPDPDRDGDPTNNNDPTPVDFGPNLFDPPFGVKTFDASGLPVLKWTMTWINNSNIVAVNAQVSDPIISGTTYADGLTCTASGISTTTLCAFEPASVAYPQGRVLWSGSIGPDLGATDATAAANELTISFNVTVNSGTTSVQNVATIDSDRNGDQDFTDPGEPRAASASRTWNGTGQSSRKSNQLPATGFAPNVVTDLSHAPRETYLSTGDVTLEIPSLGIKVLVVGVPKKNGAWNLSWLGDQAGWLEGSAFPSWNGNSVLTGHVYLASGLPGPFIGLNKLKYGDRIIIHAYGQKYTFAVQTNTVVDANDSTVMKHEQKSWLTLITCKDYDEKTGTYRNRIVVRAALVRVDQE
jgi:LPXTG-site transpeptidase (sortase) family protein